MGVILRAGTYRAARFGGATPLTILGALCPHWVTPDNRVMGTGDGILTFTNAANPANGNLTAESAGQEPQLITVGGKAYADHTPTADHVSNESVTAIWPAGATDVSMWIVGNWDDLTSTRNLFDFGTSSSNQGMSMFSIASALRVRIRAGAGNVDASFTTTPDTNRHLWECRHDPANLTLYQDGVQVAQTANTDTLDNACTFINVGRNNGGGATMDGAWRHIVTAVGAVDVGKRSAMTAWGLAEI